MNNKNTYEDGDYLMVSLVDGEGQQPQSSSGPAEIGGKGAIAPPTHLDRSVHPIQIRAPQIMPKTLILDPTTGLLNLPTSLMNAMQRQIIPCQPQTININKYIHIIAVTICTKN